MGLELEFKLAVPDTRALEEILFDKEVAAVRQGDYTLYDMATIYYDTQDKVLFARKWTLRLRQENFDLIATVKTPAGDDYARGEWSCPAQNIEEAISVLVEQGAPRELLALTQAGVKPLCLARFSRRAAELMFADGTVCELAGDVGVVAAGRKESPICEIEVELKQGDAEVAKAFAEELCDRFGLQEEPLSKFQRAAALVE